MPISVDTKQVKQQKYREKRYPIKSFTVPSNKHSTQQYYLYRERCSSFPIKIAPPSGDLHCHPPNHDFKTSSTSAPPNLIIMTNMTRNYTYFPPTTSPPKKTLRQSSLAPFKLNSPSLRMMIWSLTPHAEQPLNKFVSQKLSPICHENPLEKGPSIPYGGTLCPCSTGKLCGGICSLNISFRNWRLKLVKILNLAKKIAWQNRSVGWGIT